MKQNSVKKKLLSVQEFRYKYPPPPPQKKKKKKKKLPTVIYFFKEEQRVERIKVIDGICRPTRHPLSHPKEK